MYNRPQILKTNENVRKGVIVTQWPMVDQGSVLGEGFGDDMAEEMKLNMASSLGE